jgi:hypothetical protein
MLTKKNSNHYETLISTQVIHEIRNYIKTDSAIVISHPNNITQELVSPLYIYPEAAARKRTKTPTTFLSR